MWHFRIVTALALIVIISVWGVIGYVAYNVFSDPTATAESAGNLVKSFKKGME